MFFSQGDKDIGRNPALTRVVPAQEDLDANAFPGAGVYQRLAEEFKLPGSNPHINFPGETYASRRGKPGDIAHQ
ncbi:Uncharacterised protein [Enterobacter hormaechei]|nr:Uncharacterised protein [Enterobacter hormaechei]SAE18655.1 Uncharacterised protein [Enterobacter hormaechei]